jgi:xylulokinase
MRRLIVAHDLGTSGDKASLHDADGRLLAARTERYDTDFGHGGVAEQDPQAWWAAFCHATRALLSESGATAAEVAAVAMSGQMMGVVLVDEADLAIRPAIIWADTRAKDEAAALASAVGAERGYDITGHPIDPTYALAKMMWLREHEPDAWGRATGVLVAKDYVTLKATGQRRIDPSDASGTNAFDQVERAWSAELLEAAGVDLALLPEIVPSATVAGGLTRGAAVACGLDEGTPVVVGGGDGATSALGVGQVSGASGAVATLGSSAWISLATDRPVRDPKRRIVTFDHVVPGHFVPLGAMQAAGASLEWLRVTLGVGYGPGLEALLRDAGSVSAAAEGLFFLPYLIGERAPIWDSHARGTYVGISRHHGPAHLARALLEGIAFNLYGVFEALEETIHPIDRVDAVGGGARSNVLLQLMADTWGVPVRRRSIVDEANSLGAAVVGAEAVGLIDDWSAAASLSVVEAVFEPDQAAHTRARADYARFTDAYRRLRTWFGEEA